MAKGERKNVKIKPATLILLLPLILTGCLGGITNRQRESTETANQKAVTQVATDVTRESLDTAPISIQGVGEGAIVSIDTTATPKKVAAGTNNKSTETDDTSFYSHSTVRLPVSIALVIGGVGILLVTFAIRYAFKAAKSTSAGSAILTTADDVLARGIQSLRTLATVATDAATTAHIKSIEAELESHRGKLAQRGASLAK